MVYRRDIDGLRALAVAAVILYHCGFSLWSGGYVGVDVFFVISGYLITGIVAERAAQGTFSLAGFWKMRIRRLMVPSLFVMAACLLAFWFVYPPYYYWDLAKSAVAQALFTSNVLFYLERGYFDTASHVKPLLHTWSLSVEEQFYLFFPFLSLISLAVWKRIDWRLIGVLSLGSFILSAAFSGSSPTGAYFLLPTRAWELGVGSVLALWAREESFQRMLRAAPQWIMEALAFAGMAAILYACVGFDTETPFPSWRAAAPVLGTAALIGVGIARQSRLTRLLGWQPLVSMGLVSYSLYLWHWPSIVMNRALRLEIPSATENLVAVGVGAILACLSYRFVERPIRVRRDLVTDGRLLAGVATGVAVVAVAGVTIAAAQGLPGRFNVAYERPLPPPRVKECYNRFEGGRAVFCQVGVAKAAPDFIAIGDSHNRQLLPGLDAAAKAANTSGLFASTSGCLPLPGVSMPRDPDGSVKCRRIVDGAFAMLGTKPGQVSRLVLTARWEYYANRSEADGAFRGVAFGRLQGNGEANSRQAFQEAWNKTMDDLRDRGVKVLVIAQVPHQYFYPEDVAWRASIFGVEPNAMAVSRRRHEQDEALSRQIIQSHPYPTIVSFDNALCDSARCPIFSGATSLYFDDDHLSVTGAMKVAPALASALRQAAPPPGSP